MTHRSFPLQTHRLILRASIVTLLAVSGTAQAATRPKADNTDNLNLGSSWSGGLIPGPLDIAQWNSTVTAANSVLLGADTSWQGLAVTNPGGAVTIGGANTLTLGTSGIDLSTATQDLTISSSLTLGSGNQLWNVATGRTVTLNTGTFTRSAGASLTVTGGAGTIAANLTNLSNTSLVNGIIGPWAVVTSPGAASNGGAGGYTFATVNGSGNIAAYQGATQLTTSLWGAPGANTANYDISGATVNMGVNRTANTLRYTGAAATTYTGAAILTVNGLMNSGGGLWTYNPGVSIGTNNSNGLVLVSGSNGLTLTGAITNGAGGAGSVTVMGGSNVTLTGPNSYTGGTFVNSGRLVATNLSSGPINIAPAGTLSLNSATFANTISGSGSILNNVGGTVVFTGDHSGFSGTVTQNGGGNTQFNSANSGSQNAAYALTTGEIIFAANGDYTVRMGSLSSAALQTIRGGNSATGTTTLEVGNLGASTSILGNLNNGATKALALTKVGAGTLTLSGTNTYAGATLISGGTLAVTGTGAINSTSGININGGKYLHTSSTASTRNISLTNGTLDGTGTVGAVTVANNAASLITNGNGGTAALTIGDLSFGGAATVSVNLLGAPGLVVTGTLSTTPANGAVSVNGSGAWANGLNNLISFGTFTGAITDFTTGTINGLSGRQTAESLQLNGNNIALNVIGDNPLWTGANGGIWQQFAQGSPTSATPAWNLETGGTATDFWVGDNAVFNDDAAGTTTATISGGNVSPNSITFNNSTKDYTVTTNDGSGIATGLLVKNGSGNLTINTANSFAGGTTINAGKVTIGTATALGSGSVTVSGGDLDLGGQSIANAITLTSGGVLGDGELAGNVSGTGALTRSAGTLTLSGTNTYAGGTTLNGGTLNLNSASALGSGPVTINGGTIDNTSGSAKTLTTNNAQSWNGDIAFTGTADLDMGGGTVTLGGGTDRTATVTANTLAIGEVKSVTTEGLVKQGAGTLIVNSTGAGAAGSVIGGVLNVSSGTLRTNKAGTTGNASGDFTVAGLTGSGTIENGANDERWLFVNTAGDHTFGGTLANGGTGGLGLNKQGVGSLTLSGTNSYTGTTTIEGGTLAVTGSLGNTPINATGGTLSLENAGAFAPSVARTITVSGAGELVQTVDNAIGGQASLTAQKSLTLSRPNSYSGDTTINAGTSTTVTITNAAAAGTGRLNSATGATTPVFALHIDGGGTIAMANSFGGNSGVSTTIDVGNNGSGSDGVIQLNGTGFWGNGTLNVTGSSGYSLAIAGFTNNAGTAGTALLNPTTANLSLGSYSSSTNSAKLLQLDGTSTNNAVTGSITNGTGTVAVTKSNLSTWTLSGDNSYTGATTVTGGTLIVDGTISGSVAVNLNAGTLKGIGSITNALTVGDGTGAQDAVLAPGGSIGTLANTAGVSFLGDSVFSLEINSTSQATDLLNSAGPVSLGLGVATLTVTDLGSALLNSGESFTFITATGGVTGEFAGLPDGTLLTLGASTYAIDYNPTTVALVAVPEPTSAALLLGSLALVGLRRSRRQTA